MSETTLVGMHARTTDVPEAERFDYFRSAISEVYLGIRTEWQGTGPFDATFDAHTFDGATLARMRAPGHVGRRADTLIRRRPDEAIYLNLGVGKPHRTDHLGRAWALAPGIPMILDSEAPFLVDFADRGRFDLVSLRIEKSGGFAPHRRDVLRANERMRTTPEGAALAAQARLMATEAAAGRTHIAAAMVGPVRALLALLLDPTGPREPARLDDIKAIARARIAEPGLRADDVGASFGVTGRTVQSEFRAADETFAAWLRAERLELARQRLASPAWRTRSIAAIAASCGFADPAHFHRVFRARFGTSPGGIRG